jgi:peptidoglycan/LPS O-acetylase OafA/YrhL
MKTNYIQNLTPLRGIAALLTVLFHLDLMMGGGSVLLDTKDSFLLNKMYLMVDFFFVLSGFVMYHVYSGWFVEKVDSASFKKFTIARFARVYPLHFATLVYCVLIKIISMMVGTPTNPIDTISSNFWAIPSHIFLLHAMNLNEWFSWNNASWSISTEWWMYMLFPFLVRPFSKLKTLGHILVVVACILGYLLITFYIVPIVTEPASIPFVRVDPAELGINVSYQYGFLRCLFGFVLGMVAYKLYLQNWGKTLLGTDLALLLIIIGMGLCMHFAVPDVFTVVFFPLIILSAAYGSTQSNRLLGSRPMQSLGDWSFSIYLIHQPLLYTLGYIMSYINRNVVVSGPPSKPPMLTAWLMSLVIVSVVLLLSYLCYKYFEVPARRWINSRWGRLNELNPQPLPPNEIFKTSL